VDIQLFESQNQFVTVAYYALAVPTAISASETRKRTARVQNKLDVSHRRNLRKIIRVT